MATTSDAFRAYLDENQALPDNCTLGNIVWFTIPDGAFDGKWIEEQFALHGLNPKVLPNRIKPVNAFEKASMGLNGHKYDGDVLGQTKELLVREVYRDSEKVIRQITMEVRDAQRRKLAYGKVGDLIFNKSVTDSVTGKVRPRSESLRTHIEQGLSPADYAQLQALLAQFHVDYERYRDFYDGAKIRYIIRDYLAYLNSVMMKPSVYFVHMSRSDELTRLQTVVRSLPNIDAGGVQSCSMSLLPLADTKGLREEVVEAFQVEAEKELGEVVASITRLRSERQSLTPAAYAKAKAEYERVMRKASEYSRTLRVSQDRTAGAAEVALASLAQLEKDMRTAMVQQTGAA